MLNSFKTFIDAPRQKSAHTIIVQPDELPQTGHTHVTSTQVTEENVPDRPLVPSVSGLLARATALLTSNSMNFGLVCTYIQ